ncbi:hypothetical protein [Fodinicola acaciae]|uniref:hypothetical protein n=1 Tax=Fodinicola acaciae TaxID=2681555 RepID=UPI0013CFDF84|nr:hypothetical protein [Fodinicola acaciae]
MGFVSSLAGLAGQLPLWIVLIGGLVVTTMRRRRNPRAATLVLVGLIAALVSLLISTSIIMVAPFIPTIIRNLDLSTASYSIFIAVVNVIGSLLAAVGWVMAILALFMVRKPAPPAPAYGDSQ